MESLESIIAGTKVIHAEVLSDCDDDDFSGYSDDGEFVIVNVYDCLALVGCEMLGIELKDTDYKSDGLSLQMSEYCSLRGAVVCPFWLL